MKEKVATVFNFKYTSNENMNFLMNCRNLNIQKNPLLSPKLAL